MHLEILKNFIKNNYKYSDFNDLEFLEELRKVLVFSLGTSDYLKQLKTADLRLEEASAIYWTKTRTISLDPIEIERIIKHKEEKSGIKFPEYFKSYFYYELIFHECIHTLQFKQYFKSENNIHSTLIEDSYEVSNGNFRLERDREFKSNIILDYIANRFYNINHQFFPIEKEADVKSAMLTREIYKSFIQDEDLLNFLNLNYLKTIFYGYVSDFKLTSPTKQFYSLIKRGDKFEKLEYKSLDFNDRIALGLPITIFEVYKHIFNIMSSEDRKVLSIKMGKNNFIFKQK